MVLFLSGYGLAIACAGVGVVAVVQCFAGYAVTRKTIGFTFSSMFANISWPIVSSAAGFGIALAIALVEPGIRGGAFAIVAFGTVYLTLHLVFDRRRFLADLGQLVKLVGRKKTSQPSSAPH
jgi:hypothetical protein